MSTQNVSTRSRKTKRANSAVSEQYNLEEAILRYQKARAENRPRDLDEAFYQVCEIYPPHSYVRTWFKKYRYLYDSPEDFMQDYLRIFCQSLSAWQPRHLRPESRYGGTGDFKNFFWSSLSNHYINMVKSEASGKRNPTTQCPLCDEWCNPLSTHLLKSHVDLLWEQIKTFGHDIDNLIACPFCKSHKIPRVVPCSHQEDGACENCLSAAANRAVKKHMLSMHSTYLFERFRQLYPDCTTLPSRPTTVNVHDEDLEEEVNLYDFIPSDSKVENLLSHSLTPIQNNIIQKVFNGCKEIVYDAELYKCTSEQFQKELDDLRTTMTLCGLEG